MNWELFFGVWKVAALIAICVGAAVGLGWLAFKVEERFGTLWGWCVVAIGAVLAVSLFVGLLF